MSRLDSCGTRASLPCSMWNLPGPGIKPTSPALAGGFLTTGPPGKSNLSAFYRLRKLTNSREPNTIYPGDSWQPQIPRWSKPLFTSSVGEQLEPVSACTELSEVVPRHIHLSGCNFLLLQPLIWRHIIPSGRVFPGSSNWSLWNSTI